MIDPHCHLRDWNQSHKETLEHGFKVAYAAGLDGVFEMPNTDPALTSEENLVKRIEDADAAIETSGINIFHGIYAGITTDKKQIEGVVRAADELSPRVVGLKMFAGHSTGNMGLVDDEESTGEEKQRLVYETLAECDYRGILAVHCEKEKHIRDYLWNPEEPHTHTLARSPYAETESVTNQIEFASDAGYKGTLHICHISTPSALRMVLDNKKKVGFHITCEATPHHCILYDDMMKGEKGLYLKMNPSLRTKAIAHAIKKSLIRGDIDFIGTDHAPHTLDEKTGKVFDAHGVPMYASGVPGFAFYPHFIRTLKRECADQKRIDEITHDNIVKIYGLDPEMFPNTKRKPDYDLFDKYEFNAFEDIL